MTIFKVITRILAGLFIPLIFIPIAMFGGFILLAPGVLLLVSLVALILSIMHVVTGKYPVLFLISILALLLTYTAPVYLRIQQFRTNCMNSTFLKCEIDNQGHFICPKSFHGYIQRCEESLEDEINHVLQERKNPS